MSCHLPVPSLPWAALVRFYITYKKQQQGTHFGKHMLLPAGVPEKCLDESGVNAHPEHALVCDVEERAHDSRHD